MVSLISAVYTTPGCPSPPHKCVHCRLWYGKAGRPLSQCISSSSYGQRQLYTFGRCTLLYKFTWDTGMLQVLWNAFFSLQPPAFKPSWQPQQLSWRHSSKLKTQPTLLAMCTLHCWCICPSVEFGVQPLNFSSGLPTSFTGQANSKSRTHFTTNLTQLSLSSKHHCYSASLQCCCHLHWAVPWPHPSLLSCCRPLQAEEEDTFRENLLASSTDSLLCLLQASPGRRRGHPSRGSPRLWHRPRGSSGQLQKAAAQLVQLAGHCHHICVARQPHPAAAGFLLYLPHPDHAGPESGCAHPIQEGCGHPCQHQRRHPPQARGGA